MLTGIRSVPSETAVDDDLDYRDERSRLMSFRSDLPANIDDRRPLPGKRPRRRYASTRDPRTTSATYEQLLMRRDRADSANGSRTMRWLGPSPPRLA
jgi:hypothetical protein